MGITDKVKSLFRSRDKPQNHTGDNLFSFLYNWGMTWTGKRITGYNAMQTTGVYACVRIIAETVASLPWHIYRYTADGKVRDYKHPLYFLLHDEPNPEMTSFSFRETIMTHLLLWGNAYSQIIRNGRGEVIGLYPLMPNKMYVTRNPADKKIYYKYTTDNEGTIILSSDDVWHIPGLGFDGLVGYSPIAMAKQAIGLDVAAEEYGASFFRNGATPSGVLTHPGHIKDPEKMREAWESTYGGTNSSHRTAILEEGVKYERISIPPNEAQFLETRKFQLTEICRIFRVPPHMVADLDKATFSNIEQQSLDFVQNTIRPWLVRIEQSGNSKLLIKSEKGTVFNKFNVDGLLRGDFQSRMQGYAIGRQNGWYSANDIRELEDMNRIPAEQGGDEYLCNGNMTKLSDAGNWNK